MAQFTTEVDQLAKELSWLRQEFDGIKGVVNGWTGGAGTDPYFNYLRARDGFFDKPILESARFRRINSDLEFDGIKGVVNGWTGGAGTDPYFNYLRARDGFFDKPILESARFRRINSNQEFANGVAAGVEWDEETWNTGLFSWSSIINSSRIYLRAPASGQHQGILASGYASWTTISTSGQRYIQIDQYRSDDTLIGGERVVTAFPVVEGEANMPFNLPMRANSSWAYIVVSGFQSGGATMSLPRCFLGLFRLF